MTHSIAGGTGSAAGKIFGDLSDIFGKLNNTSMTLFPSNDSSDPVIAPYNAVLGMHDLLEDYNHNISSSMIFQNEAIFNRCIEDANIQSPSLSHANEVLARVFTSFSQPLQSTSSGSYSSMTLNELTTNMIPYPGIKFLGCSLGKLPKPDSPINLSTFDLFINSLN